MKKLLIFIPFLLIMSSCMGSEKSVSLVNSTALNGLNLNDTVVLTFSEKNTSNFIIESSSNIFTSIATDFILTLTISDYGKSSLTVKASSTDPEPLKLTITANKDHDLALVGRWGENVDRSNDGSIDRYVTLNSKGQCIIAGTTGTWKTVSNELIIECGNISEKTLYLHKSDDYDNDGVDDDYYKLNTGTAITILESID